MSQMIRLTFLVDSPSRGAHGNAASRLALGLYESGQVEPTLLCYSADPPPPWLPRDVRVCRLRAEKVSRALPELMRYLRVHQPDVLVTRQVHANLVGLVAAGTARVPPRWRGKLVLVQDHPIELSHAANWRDNKWLAKAGYRFADAVISPSPEVRASTIAWCRLDPMLTELVPNPIPSFSGVGDEPPHPWLDSSQPPVFVHTSNMTPWKRLDLLIDAFADLRAAQEARLLIVGEGPGRAAAAAQIERLGLLGDAATVGWVDDPLQFAARAWAFVLPSDEEGFAQVLTEAMSTGCPVIATDAQGGGPRFVTEEGECGMLVPRGDREQLAAAMAHMLQADVRAKYSELGRSRAQALSPRACATGLVDFLGRLLEI